MDGLSPVKAHPVCDYSLQGSLCFTMVFMNESVRMKELQICFYYNFKRREIKQINLARQILLIVPFLYIKYSIFSHEEIKHSTTQSFVNRN